MFFVFGSPRSGTTLLAQLLSNHPQVVVPGETDFIVPLAFLCDRVKDSKLGLRLAADLVASSAAFDTSLGEYLPRDKVRALVGNCRYQAAQIIETVFAALARAAGKRLAGDKSPNDLQYLRILVQAAAIPPGAKIIHIVRDVRDVVSSLLRTSWAPRDAPRFFPRFWSANNLYLAALYEGRPEYLPIRYEDLVADVPAACRRLADHLAIEFDARMLDQKQFSNRYRGQAHHDNLYRTVTAERVSSWKTELDPALVQGIETQAGEALLRFGYPRES